LKQLVARNKQLVARIKQHVAGNKLPKSRNTYALNAIMCRKQKKTFSERD